MGSADLKYSLYSCLISYWKIIHPTFKFFLHKLGHMYDTQKNATNFFLSSNCFKFAVEYDQCSSFPMNFAPELQFCVCKNLEKSHFSTFREIFCHFVFFEFHFFPEFVSLFRRRDYLGINWAVSSFAAFFKFFTSFEVDIFQLVYLLRVRCVKWVQDQQK